MWLLRRSECPLMHREMLSVFSFVCFFQEKDLVYELSLTEGKCVCLGSNIGWHVPLSRVF